MVIHLGLRKKFLKLKYGLRREIYKLKGDITLGRNVVLEGSIDTPWKSGIIIIDKNTVIRKWVCLRPYGGKIKIGENCTINSFCHISGNGEVEIGNNVLIATQCVIVSANHNFDTIDVPISQQGETREKIVIEDNCWLGAGVKVLAGVTIHQGTVIGAGSVVTHDIPENSVAVGIPARVIRKRCSNE